MFPKTKNQTSRQHFQHRQQTQNDDSSNTDTFDLASNSYFSGFSDLLKQNCFKEKINTKHFFDNPGIKRNGIDDFSVVCCGSKCDLYCGCCGKDDGGSVDYLKREFWCFGVSGSQKYPFWRELYRAEKKAKALKSYWKEGKGKRVVVFVRKGEKENEDSYSKS